MSMKAPVTMPLPPYIHVDQAAARQESVHGTISLVKLVPEKDILNGGAALDVHLKAGRALDGTMYMQVLITGQASLVCQTCLSPVTWDIHIDKDVALVKTEQEMIQKESEWDCWLVPGMDMTPWDHVREEVLLAWPMIPRHDHCQHPEYSS